MYCSFVTVAHVSVCKSHSLVEGSRHFVVPVSERGDHAEDGGNAAETAPADPQGLPSDDHAEGVSGVSQ